MNGPPPTTRTRRAHVLLFVVAMLAVPLAVSAMVLQATFTLLDTKRSTGEVLRIALSEQLTLLAVLVPIVLAGRRLLRRPTSARARISIHIGSLILLVLVATTARWAVAQIMELPLPGDLATAFLAGSMAKSVIAYGAACLLFWALDNERRAREQQQAADALAARERELRAEVTAARLAALRSRLEPHFLFNALNAIGSLILTASAERAHDGLTRLSDLLRNVLAHTDSPTATLRTEFARVEDYLAIEQLRFGDRLSVNLECAPDCGAAEVPVMLLMPVVENAIQHGVARRPKGGTVTVRAQRNADQLTLEVRDEGGGPGTEGEHGFGIGLQGCRERLRVTYGKAACLERTELPNGCGTCVHIGIPWSEVHPAAPVGVG